MPVFSATPAMVATWLPHLTINDTTEPSTTQVAQWIAMYDNSVSFAVGTLASLIADPTKAAFVARLQSQGSQVVALGAATVAWAAKNPESVDPANGAGYGRWLSMKYEKELQNLAETALRGTDDPDMELAPNLGPQWVVPSCRPAQNTLGRPLFVDVIEPNPDGPYSGPPYFEDEFA